MCDLQRSMFYFNKKLYCIGLYWTYNTTSTANFGGEWKDYINLEYSLSKPVRFWFSLKILFCNNTEHREQWQQKLVARCVILCSAILVGPNSLTKYTNMLHILRDSWQQAISVIESVTKWMFFLINVLSTELELNKLCS